jgi:hypothetical protein
MEYTSEMIKRWYHDDIEAGEWPSDGIDDTDWQARYEEAIMAGDYEAARYAKAQIVNI